MYDFFSCLSKSVLIIEATDRVALVLSLSLLLACYRRHRRTAVICQCYLYGDTRIW